jgi:hypothetical protein
MGALNLESVEGELNERRMYVNTAACIFKSVPSPRRLDIDTTAIPVYH